VLRILREEPGTLTLGSRLERQLLRSKDGNGLRCGQLSSETVIQLRRRARARALPDAGLAKLDQANTSTEITIFLIILRERGLYIIFLLFIRTKLK
jgi:hypothetical protein